MASVTRNFTLPDLSGTEFSLWDYRQRQPLVVVFAQAEGDAFLRDLAEHYAQYRRRGAEVLLVVTREPAGRKWPFPVLLDGDGSVTARFAGDTPTVLVLDRYGETFARLKSPGPGGIDHREVLEWLLFVESQCPECGAPVWE